MGETAAEPPGEDPKDTINQPDALAHEATYINRTFSQQVLRTVRVAVAALGSFRRLRRY